MAAVIYNQEKLHEYVYANHILERIDHPWDRYNEVEKVINGFTNAKLLEVLQYSECLEAPVPAMPTPEDPRVIELLAADKQYDEARKAHNETYHSGGMVARRNTETALRAAKSRRHAALAAFAPTEKTQ